MVIKKHIFVCLIKERHFIIFPSRSIWNEHEILVYGNIRFGWVTFLHAKLGLRFDCMDEFLSLQEVWLAHDEYCPPFSNRWFCPKIRTVKRPTASLEVNHEQGGFPPSKFVFRLRFRFWTLDILLRRRKLSRMFTGRISRNLWRLISCH